VDIDAELLGDEPVRRQRASDPGPEDIEADPRESWRPPWVLIAVVLAVLVGVLAWNADRRARAHESQDLATCQQALHNAVITSDLQMVSVAVNIRPTLASTTGRKHAATLALMAWPARRVLPDVVRADQGCRALSIRPWHRSLEARRDAAVAYSGALTAKLREVAADGRAYYRDDSALRRLRRAADIGVFGGRY
jgi:hypothetical protein